MWEIACKEMQERLQRIHYEWLISQPLDRPLDWSTFFFYYE
jgi:hypothetical protein